MKTRKRSGLLWGLVFRQKPDFQRGVSGRGMSEVGLKVRDSAEGTVSGAGDLAKDLGQG